MEKILQEKYVAMDVIFNLQQSKHRYFYLEREDDSYKKVYSLLVFYADEEIKNQKLEEINKVLKSEDFTKMLKETTADLERIDKEYDFHKKEYFGTIKCHLLPNEIVVEVNTKKHNKRFAYGENDFMDDFLTFLDEELNAEAKELFFSLSQ